MADSITPIFTAFTGRVIRVAVEHVTLPNGTQTDLEIVHHPGGAAIVVLDARERVCLLRQYRHAAGGWIWELPAGKIDDGELPLETARRELEEETGVRAETWCSLGDCLSSPGVFTEVVHLFLATRLTSVARQPEAHEVMEVHWVSFDEALSMAHTGELRDAKSLAGLMRASARLSRPACGRTDAS